jgi:hypothetical protein
MKIAVHISNTEWDIGGANGEHHQVVHPDGKSLATTMLPVVV